jgi:hypothetical protein
MEFKEWLLQTKKDKPELDDFISKLETFFGDSGFNAAEFERKISLGINKIDSEVDNSLKNDVNAQN